MSDHDGKVEVFSTENLEKSSSELKSDKDKPVLPTLDYEFTKKLSETPENSKFQVKVFPQLLAATAACLGGFCYGTLMCYSGVAFPKLRADPNFGPVTEDQISWMSSIVTLGALASCPIIGVSADWLGRRRSMIYMTLPFVSGWLCIYFAPSVPLVLLGRFLTGFCGGSFNLLSPIFIAETAEPGIRGMLISGFMLMSSIGGLFIFILGSFLSWRISALVSAFVPLLTHLILFFVPETPRFLLSKGKEDEALDSLCWFRGTKNPQDVKPEFYQLVENIEQSSKDSSSGKAIKEVLRELSRLPVLKAIFISFMLFFFQVFSGIYSVDFYVVDILESAGASFDPYYATIIIWIACCITSAVSVLVIEGFGRKPLMVVSELLMVLSLGTLSVFFYLKAEVIPGLPTSTFGQFIPLVSLSVLLGGFCIGVGMIPSAVMPELLPQSVRGVASSALLICKWVMMFIAGRYFKDFMSGLGEIAGYGVLAGICVLGIFFVLICVPETTGRSLEETSGTTKAKKRNEKSAEAEP